MFELIKALGIKASTLFNSDFTNNNILSCFSYFFLITDLYFLIPAFITQVFNPIAELVIPIETPTKEMEAHPVNAEIKKKKC